MGEEPQAAEAAKKGSGLNKIIIYAGVALVFAIAGLLVFLFVLKPMLEGGGADEPAEDDKIPATVVEFQFDETFASVEMPEGMAAATLLYQITFACANDRTSALIDRNRSRFINMLGELHRNRTREEWRDPLVQEGIRKQALEKANEILRRLQAEVDPDIRVTDVFYDQFYISEL